MGNIPTTTKNLLVINILAFLATWVFQRSGVDLNALFGLHFFLASDFHVYQFLTYMFLHGGFTHILFNMFALWMFGSVIERVWGSKKFIFYYIVCGVGAGIIQEIVQYVNFSVQGLAAYDYVSISGQRIAMDVFLNQWMTIGASGAVYGILLAFGMIFPNERLFIIPIPFPIKAKWLIIGYIFIELFSAMGQSDGVAHMAHLGGMLFGFLLIRYWQKHPDSSQRFGRSSGQEFFDNLKRRYENHRQQHEQNNYSERQDPRRESDEDYNARQRKNQEEIDAILDKIRKSGYDSLTKEEKKKLFDQSRPS